MSTPHIPAVSRVHWTQAVSLVMAMSALLALIVALVMAPPRSGPFCRGDDCITYPYTDAVAHVPNDYVWMYFAVVMSLAFLAWVACLVGRNPASISAAGILAVALAAIATTLLLLAYGVQLLVMQPSLLKGESEGLSPWSQYNAHGIFIALESLGYWMAGLSLVSLAVTVARSTRTTRWLRRISLLAGMATVMLLPMMGLIYRSDLEYRYEVGAIAILWPALTILGVLGARMPAPLSAVTES